MVFQQFGDDLGLRLGISVMPIAWTGAAARASGRLPRLPVAGTHFCPGRLNPARRGTVWAERVAFTTASTSGEQRRSSW